MCAVCRVPCAVCQRSVWISPGSYNAPRVGALCILEGNCFIYVSLFRGSSLTPALTPNTRYHHHHYYYYYYYYARTLEQLHRSIPFSALPRKEVRRALPASTAGALVLRHVLPCTHPWRLAHTPHAHLQAKNAQKQRVIEA